MTFVHARPPLPVGRVLNGALQWVRHRAVLAVLCMAWAASPALAQQPNTYQGHLDQCLANAKSAQDSLRRGIAKATAEGNTARVDMLTQRLESHLATTPQKCETFSRETAENQAKIAAARQETAELRKINESFRQFNTELPQLTRDLEAVLAGKIAGGQSEAVINKL